MIKTKLYWVSWVETDKKINVSKITTETIYNLHCWVWNHPRVVNSSLENDRVSIKDNTTGEVIKHKINLIKYQSDNYTMTL